MKPPHYWLGTAACVNCGTPLPQSICSTGHVTLNGTIPVGASFCSEDCMRTNKADGGGCFRLWTPKDGIAIRILEAFEVDGETRNRKVTIMQCMEAA